MGSVWAPPRRVNAVLALAAALFFTSTPALAAPSRKVQQAYRGLEHASFKVRVKSIGVLVKSRDQGAAAAIRGMLKDADPTVRAAACDAAARLKDTAAVEDVRALLTDTSPLVARRAEAAMKKLDRGPRGRKSGRVVFTLDEPANLTKTAGLELKLVEGARKKLGTMPRILLAERAGTTGYLVSLTVQRVEEKAQGPDALMNVAGAATVMELPGRQLKFATRVQAAAGKAAPLTDAERTELTDDGARACGEALADELGKWMARQ